MSFDVRNLRLSDLPQLKRFKCGNPSMDTFLVNEAYLNHIHGEGITKVVTKKDTDDIIAYYSLKCDAVKIIDDDMYPEPRYIPCVEISRIAVLNSWQKGQQGIHLGTNLMGQIITFIKEKIANHVGCRFITLHAVKSKVDWYQREFQFKIDEELSDEETTYMLLDLIDNDKVKEYVEYKKTLSN